MLESTCCYVLCLCSLMTLRSAPAAVPTSLRPDNVAGIPIVIRLYLQTELEPRVVGRARMLATTVLRHAGAEPIWLIWWHTSADGPPSKPIDPNDLIVRIVPIGMDTRSTTCGTAIGRLVTVFANCVNHTSALYEIDPASIDPATVYAYTLVHEIGHLLLPPGHAIVGVMRARPDWLRAAQNTLDFTPDEIVRIRSALAARVTLAPRMAKGPDNTPRP